MARMIPLPSLDRDTRSLGKRRASLEQGAEEAEFLGENWVSVQGKAKGSPREEGENRILLRMDGDNHRTHGRLGLGGWK